MIVFLSSGYGTCIFGCIYFKGEERGIGLVPAKPGRMRELSQLKSLLVFSVATVIQIAIP